MTDWSIRSDTGCVEGKLFKTNGNIFNDYRSHRIVSVKKENSKLYVVTSSSHVYLLSDTFTDNDYQGFANTSLKNYLKKNLPGIQIIDLNQENFEYTIPEN